MGYKNSELLNDSIFHNKCKYCNKCCHSEKVIVLSPIDIILIKRTVGVKNFDETFMITTNKNDNFPLVTLKKREGKCIYVNKENECILGNAKPHQCSILPIAKKLVMPQDEFRYYYSSAQNCINKKKISSIENVTAFLHSKNNKYECVSDNWYRAYYKFINLGGGFENLIRNLHPSLSAVLIKVLIDVLYKSVFDLQNISLDEVSVILEEKYKIAKLAILEAERMQIHINDITRINTPIIKRKSKLSVEEVNVFVPELENIICDYEYKFRNDNLSDVKSHELIYNNETKTNFFQKLLKIFIS